MPYQVTKEDIVVPCGLLLCEYNNQERCDCDCDVEDLEPNREEWCTHYAVRESLDAGYLFKTVEEMQRYRDEDFMDGVPFIAFDPGCLRVIYKKIKSLKGPCHEALIQISEEDEKNYEYKPCVDGGILMVPKDQMDLFTTAVGANSK